MDSEKYSGNGHDLSNGSAFERMQSRYDVTWEEWKEIAYGMGRLDLIRKRMRILDLLVQQSFGPLLWNATMRITGSDSVNRKGMCSMDEHNQLVADLNEVNQEICDLDKKIEEVLSNGGKIEEMSQ